VLEIFFRAKAQQREFETILARCFPVTAAAVASELGEDRNDLRRKADGGIRIEAFDHKIERRFEAGRVDGMDLDFPVLQGGHQPVGIDLNAPCRFDAVGDVTGSVALFARGRRPGHDQLQAGIAAAESRRGGGWAMFELEAR
jgi:hypothetical protein